MDWCLGDAAQHYSSLQEHFPGDSSLLTEPNWTNTVTSLHTHIHASPTCSKPSAFPRLSLGRILASLIGLNWCVSSLEEPLFQIWNNHILSQAQTLLHSWKTPIPRRIFPFCVLSKKCTEFGNIWTMLIISIISQNLQLGIQTCWIRKNKKSAVNKDHPSLGLCKVCPFLQADSV